jgi:pimeloyl-ACP methyl ester carboxylesterase
MPLVKTVLLCFIHGFKGDEETFFKFPADLQKHVSEKEPEVDVHTAVYPKYETQGDLAASVETFKDWLQERVTALEQKAGTQNAITDPSVSVILIAHSMGGFVAADTLFAILDNRPVSSDPSVKLMFPLVQGILLFDCPLNGLSRSMFAYGAFSQYQNISQIWNIGSSVGSLLSGAGAAAAAGQARSVATKQMMNTARNNPSWQRWQILAARTGTYGAVIAGGVAAYSNRAEIKEYLSNLNRENISQSFSKANRDKVSQNVYDGLAQVPAYVSRESIGEGFAWMAGHLKFVGALMKQAQLKTRLDRLSQIKGVGLVNFYTSLGENGYWNGGYFVPKRTFCAIPTGTEALQIFREQPNAKAKDEIAAHCSMFIPTKNPHYEEMSMTATDMVCEWLKIDPRTVIDDYEPSQGEKDRTEEEHKMWDDDGKVVGKREHRRDSVEEDQLQLQAILAIQGMPQAEDGGVSDEDLKKAAETPLPAEEVTWRSRVAGFSLPSMPAIPSAMPYIPSIPMASRKVKEGDDMKGTEAQTESKAPADEETPKAEETKTEEKPKAEEPVKASKSWMSSLPSMPSIPIPGWKKRDSGIAVTDSSKQQKETEADPDEPAVEEGSKQGIEKTSEAEEVEKEDKKDTAEETKPQSSVGSEGAEAPKPKKKKIPESWPRWSMPSSAFDPVPMPEGTRKV